MQYYDHSAYQLRDASLSVAINVGAGLPATAAASPGRAETQTNFRSAQQLQIAPSALGSQHTLHSPALILPEQINGYKSPSATPELFNPAPDTSAAIISHPKGTQISVPTPELSLAIVTPHQLNAPIQATASPSFTFISGTWVPDTTPQAKRLRPAVPYGVRVLGRTRFVECSPWTLAGYKSLTDWRQNSRKGLNAATGIDSVINGMFCNMIPNLVSLVSQPSALHGNGEDLMARLRLLQGSLHLVQLPDILKDHEKHASIRRTLYLTGFFGDFLPATGGDVLSRVEQAAEKAEKSLAFRLTVDLKALTYRLYAIQEIDGDHRAGMASFLTELVGWVRVVEEDHEVNIEDKQLYFNLVRLLFMVLEVIAYQEVPEWMMMLFLTGNKFHHLWAIALLDRMSASMSNNAPDEQGLSRATLEGLAASDSEPCFQWCRFMITSWPAILEEAQKRCPQDARLL